jgi:hypothetical protein
MCMCAVAMLPAIYPVSRIIVPGRWLPHPKTTFLSLSPVSFVEFAIIPFVPTLPLSQSIFEIADVFAVHVVLRPF